MRKTHTRSVLIDFRTVKTVSDSKYSIRQRPPLSVRNNHYHRESSTRQPDRTDFGPIKPIDGVLGDRKSCTSASLLFMTSSRLLLQHGSRQKVCLICRYINKVLYPTSQTQWPFSDYGGSHNSHYPSKT